MDNLGSARAVSVFGHRFAVVGPSIRDPRVHLAAVIVSLQVLGQVSFGFEVSIAQILISIGTCAAIEVVVTALRRSVLAWPASALVAGNGVALLLRVNGTRAGDWWSLHGAWIFGATAAVAMGSKYLVRIAGRPLFNPSNVALVLCFVTLGTDRVNPLDLWWAPADSPAMLAAYTVIVVGGLGLIYRVGMIPATAGFAVTFVGGAALLAIQGHTFTARWNVGALSDGQFVRTLVWSPETLVFAFFMLTDPKTAPRGRVGRTVYGTLVGAVSISLIGTQNREFDVKVMLLVALVAVCALRPLIERWTPEPGSRDHLAMWLGSTANGPSRPRAVARLSTLAMAGVTLVTLLPVHPVQRDLDLVEIAADLPDDAVGSEAELGHRLVPRITPAARDLANAVEPATAQAMADALLRALAIVDATARDGDAERVRLVVTPRFEAQLASVSDGGLDYRIRELSVVVVRDATDSQAEPMLALRATGTQGGDTTAFDRVFFLVRANGRYLLDRDQSAAEVEIDDSG